MYLLKLDRAIFVLWESLRTFLVHFSLLLLCGPRVQNNSTEGTHNMENFDKNFYGITSQ